MMVVGFECKFHFPTQNVFVSRGALSCCVRSRIIIVVMKLDKHQKDYMLLNRSAKVSLGDERAKFQEKVYVLERNVVNLISG